MLVLRRQTGESVVIGTDPEITIKVLSQQEGFVRLGIEAPKEISVDREEVSQKKKKALLEKILTGEMHV